MFQLYCVTSDGKFQLHRVVGLIFATKLVITEQTCVAKTNMLNVLWLRNFINSLNFTCNTSSVTYLRFRYAKRFCSEHFVVFKVVVCCLMNSLVKQHSERVTFYGSYPYSVGHSFHQ